VETVVRKNKRVDLHDESFQTLIGRLGKAVTLLPSSDAELKAPPGSFGVPFSY